MVFTDLPVEAIRERLATASKRGRLAGYQAPVEGADLAVAAHGAPFDATLRARLSEGALRFELRPLWRMPGIFIAALVLGVWPGVLVMDSLIPGEWGWIPTWWWYVPLTALPAPFAWRTAWRKSKSSWDVSAREMIAKIAGELGGRVG